LTPPGPLSAQNVIAGCIASIRERSGQVWVSVEASGEDSPEIPGTRPTARTDARRTRLVARVTRRALAALRLEEGGTVHLIFKANAVRAATRTDKPAGP